MFYKVGLKRNDSTIVEAIVEADNKTAARAKALQNAKRIVKGQEEKTNVFYSDRDYGYILGRLDATLKAVSVKSIDMVDYKDYFGYTNYYVLLFDNNGLFLTNCTMVNDMDSAYKRALTEFHRKQMVEGFLFKVAQPCTVSKNKVHNLVYFYHAPLFKGDISYLKMEQYKNFSVIDLGLSHLSLAYIGPHMTINEMLSKLVPEGSLAEKPLYLLYATSGLIKTNVSYVWWNPSADDIEVNDGVSDDYYKFEDYEAYIAHYSDTQGRNFINLATVDNVDVVSECLADRERYERLEAYDEMKAEISDKLDALFMKNNDLMSEEQKVILSNFYNNFEFNHVFGTVLWALTSGSTDDDWGSPFEDSFNDTDTPPTEPKKSIKPKSKASKGKKKVGK